MHELIECVKKNPATSIVIVIALVAFVYMLYNKKENLGTTMSISGTPVKSSIGIKMLGASCGAICSCILPLIILYYITKSSAKAAINSTVCSNPEILKSLLGK
jgi:hypothetical protein